jgi:hypothetical protein
MEATGYAHWFERMLAQLGHELWVGDAAEIQAAMVRKQKTDSRDARHILDLLLQDRFPRIWILSPAKRDLRQLLRHRPQDGWLTNFGEDLASFGHGASDLPKKEVVGQRRTWGIEGLALTGSQARGAEIPCGVMPDGRGRLPP